MPSKTPDPFTTEFAEPTPNQGRHVYEWVAVLNQQSKPDPSGYTSTNNSLILASSDGFIMSHRDTAAIRNTIRTNLARQFPDLDPDTLSNHVEIHIRPFRGS